MARSEQEPIDHGRTGYLPGRVLWVIAVALFIALMLNATELEHEAKSKPYGRNRDIWVNVWKPFAFVSHTLYIDRPRAWLDDAIGRGDDGSVFELPPASGDSTPTGNSPEPTATRGSKTPSATATPAPPKQLVRTPTAEDRLRIWVGGDSMSKILGEALVRQATETGLMDPIQDSQLSSGLTRPDFFDWPGHFNDLVHQAEPSEVFVVMFGANDSQGIKTPEGKIFQEAGTDGWNAEYRRRVAGTMDLLKADNRLVIWVGQPIMRSAELSERMAALNSIYKEEAAKRPWVRYFDLWPLFVTSSGAYDPYIADDDGEVKLMRNPDGVHLVRDGGEKAARHIMELIKQEAHIP